MNKIERSTLKIRRLLSPVIGEIKVKTYFSFYGFFAQNMMFGLLKGNKFYLKVSRRCYQEITTTEGVTVLNVDGLKIKPDQYYYIPLEILKNAVSYSDWFYSIIEEQLETLPERKEKRHHIRYLPNMNFNLERLLNRYGIHSIEQFFELGAIQVFMTLVKNGIEANKSLLFKLYGAVNHKFANMLTEEEKATLLCETNQAFYLAGLRQPFMLKKSA